MKEWDDEMHEEIISCLSILYEHRKVDVFVVKYLIKDMFWRGLKFFFNIFTDRNNLFYTCK